MSGPADVKAYNDHVKLHEREGYAVGSLRLAMEDDELDDVLVSEDEISIFSESGIESEADSEANSDSENEDIGSLFFCQVKNVLNCLFIIFKFSVDFHF